MRIRWQSAPRLLRPAILATPARMFRRTPSLSPSLFVVLFTTAVLSTACGGNATVIVHEGDDSNGEGLVSGSTPPLGKLPNDVTPTSYNLDLTINPDEETFSGTAAIRVELTRPRQTLWLHGRDLEVSAAQVIPEGQAPIAARWSQVDKDGVAKLELDQPLAPGRATIAISYQAKYSDALNGLYRVKSGEHHYAFTQFEAIDARQAFPSFDEPRFKTPFEVSITTKKDYEAAANTLVTATEPADNGMKTVRYAKTRALPTYLIAWAVGPLDVVQMPAIAANDVRKTALPYRGLAVKGKGEQLRYALEHTPALLGNLEQYFASAYPYDKLDIVAVPDFAAGAMENAGLITFREPLLLIDEDNAPTWQFQSFAYVMAHELAHQWFGNLVTMPWWDDLWLNEAFATWMGNKVVRKVNPEYRADLSFVESADYAMQSDSMANARRIRQPIESNHDISNAFDSITYSKGGAVLEMFERWLGEETFRDGLRHHMRKHAFKTATAEDLVASLSEVSGQDVAPAFFSFLTQPGVPYLNTSLACGDKSGAELTIEQTRFLPLGSTASSAQHWTLPVCVRYGSKEGEPSTKCSVVAEAKATLTLDSCPSWIMPNAEGAGYYRFGMDDEAMKALQKDGFSELSEREKIAFAHSLQASFENGQIKAAELFEAIKPLAKSPIRQVASVAESSIAVAHTRLVDEKARPRVERFGSKVFTPAYKRLGWTARKGETPDDAFLRTSVINFMTDVANDKAVRRTAKQKGQAYVAGGKVNKKAVSSDLAPVVLSVAVQDGDAKFFELVKTTALDNDDATTRSFLLRALASTKDLERGKAAMDLAFDEKVRTNEVRNLLRPQFAQRETRDAAWTWLQSNWDAYVKRVSTEGAGGAPGLAGRFCSEAKAKEVEAFFKDKVGNLRGGPRNLALALERIRLCAARVDAHAQDTNAYFTKNP